MSNGNRLDTEGLIEAVAAAYDSLDVVVDLRKENIKYNYLHTVHNSKIHV